MAQPHGRSNFYVVGEGIYEVGARGPVEAIGPRPITSTEQLRKFRFSRVGPKGFQPSLPLLENLAAAMVLDDPTLPDSSIPAGFTYLGQFVDHDMTLDKTAKFLGEDVSVTELQQGRSPGLDLDCLYGRGPTAEPQFYSDGAHLKVGTTTGTSFPAGNPKVGLDLRGFDVPRVGLGSTARDRREPLIPDARNDENLVVAQTHAAFIRFHNRMVDEAAGEGGGGLSVFERARAEVTLHYQWMLVTDFLPRIVDPDTLADVFGDRTTFEGSGNGRRHFECSYQTGATRYDYRPRLPRLDRYGSIPIEFTVGAYRLGHSMVRRAYDWNSVFSQGGPGGSATLELLFNFTGTSGTLSPPPSSPAVIPNDPNFGSFERLPTNWIADWRRLYDFQADAGRIDLAAPGGVNHARSINTLLTDPLRNLPVRSFGQLSGPMPAHLQVNLAFRNLVRARMLNLASGQQMAQMFGAPSLTEDQIVIGLNGAQLQLTDPERRELRDNTPLWFYVLREAEAQPAHRQGRLGPVGSRIVAETFHRALECSRHSIVKNPFWRPSKGPDHQTFKMVHLLLYAFGDNASMLTPI